MRNYKLSKSALCVLLCVLLQPFSAYAQQSIGRRAGETEDFRRSSLCLMLITHNGDKYASDIEAQFKAMPLPTRYNGLNVDVRCISTYSKSTDASVAKMLKDRGVAKELVGKWFNRDYYGRMNMERIHSWGGYNATYADLQRANRTVRGVDMLSDEGSELIKNTFVLVCDISYFDRTKTGGWLSAIAAVAGAAMDVMAEHYESKGQDASAYRSLAETAYTGQKAAEDIAGFSVNVMARLYRLKWNDNMRDYFYTQYWVGQDTPDAEAQSKKAAFDRDNSSYELEYLGNYRSRAGRTVSKAANDLNLVIRDVCSNAVNRSINNLSKMFPVFKAKTPYYCDGGYIYAYIGSKEGVTSGSKFEILETKKTKSGYEYNKVATVKASNVWNNRGQLIQDMSMQTKGTSFRHVSGRSNICDGGLLMREAGKLGYQYKRHRWFFEPFAGAGHMGDDGLGLVKLDKKASKQWEKDLKKGKNLDKPEKVLNGTEEDRSNFKCQPITVGLTTGWIINYHTNIAWNVFNLGFAYGMPSKLDTKKSTLANGDKGKESFMSASLTTGLILRTNPLGKNGMFALYLWPTVGARYSTATASYKWGAIGNRQVSTYKIKDMGILDWNVKAGVTLGEQISIGASINDMYWAGMITFYL